MITLQYFNQSNFEQLISWIPSKESLLQWSGTQFTYPLNESQLVNYIAGANQNGSDRFIYKIIEDETGSMIGHISLGRIDYRNRSARIGKVFVHDSMRGKKVAHVAIEKVLRQAFEDMGLHRVTLGVFDFNESAIRCYERVGFKTEGLLRDHRRIGEEYWSLYEMAMLEGEWREMNKKKSAR
ncbi:GNAT family N-acetyltransferase [Pontibacillus salipaludis]|uniref:Aminoglycoside N(6')-acetyltransferase n=1 Tax=Pontibacillus salipaludis TaxID=1697394 RepID=A0ABQ1Q5W4_9BACI|nr:GNAT family protein [Pontibacillus salipaludis]GGD15380.1 aminoglycoside N(6')-acetyltransferase [Pontibacillus salipaludis]